MMKSLWALFFTKATARLFSNYERQQRLARAKVQYDAHVDLPDLHNLSFELIMELAGNGDETITKVLHGNNA